MAAILEPTIGKLDGRSISGSLPPISAVLGGIKRHRVLAAAVAVVLVAALALGSLVATRSSAQAAYQTQTVLQQNLSQTVTASGTVNPQNTVTVGTQVSGTISALYVDYNSKVKKGQVLAKLDTSQLQAQLEQAKAALAQAQAQAAAQSQNAIGAQANIAVSQQNSAAQAANAQAAQAAIQSAAANVQKAQSALTLAQLTQSRDTSLLSQGYIAQSQYDSDAANLASAQSALQAAQAAEAQSRAQAQSSASQAQAGSAQSTVNAAQAAASADTAQAAQASVAAAQAQVQQDELNIQRAVITSPVDGTVISRAVSVGQTVAASLQTPTLFTIAQDLTKMEVDINVGEPDIGNVRAGDPVTFSVLAYPNETFSGTVSQVRVNPATVNNVVTYTVITLVNNPQNKLLPGMTANASINVQTAKNALVVPTQALSFHPAYGGKGKAGAKAGTSSTPWGQAQAGGSAPAAGSTGSVYVRAQGKAVRVPVKVNLISGTQAAVTPVKSGTLSAGDEVIISASTGSRTHTAHAQSGASSGPGGRGGMGGIGRAIR